MSVDELIRPLSDVDVGFVPASFDQPGFDPEAFALMRGVERDASLLHVDQLIRGLTVLRAEMIHVVATSATFTDDAHHTPKAWVEAVLNASPATAANLVRSAALLAEVPMLANAVRAGSVGLDQVDELRRLHANQRCRQELQTHGYRLVGHAKSLTFANFRKVLIRWKAHVDPDGTHRDHEVSREKRHVRSGVTGHEGVIHAEGDAASIEEMVEILRAHADSEFSKDCEERAARYGEDAAQYPLRRTHGQRMFDAFQEIFRKAAGTPVAGVSEPTVNIFTTEAELAAAIAEYFGQPVRSPQRSGGVRFSETESGSPVDPAEMVVAALLGKIRRVVVTEDGRYVSAGRPQRLFTGKLREMILLLDGHMCNRHGCHVRGASVQVDHLQSWDCHGCTTASNGGPMCPLHNRDKHRLGFTVTHDQHGWHHFRPDGTEIAPRGT
ncbi:MAG: DUF222 domain-containing protein [Ilumatobacteraceae bacterium]